MTPNSMLPWPDEPHLTAPRMQWLDYERARAEAALSRLRIAVEALKDAHEALSRSYDVTEWPGPGGESLQESSMKRVAKNLAEIGEIPQS